MRTSSTFRVLSLDGGGAKGFYTLGVLHQMEALIGCRLYERFDLVYGTSTGAIIAALICLGYSVEEIHDLYRHHVVRIMAAKRRSAKSAALADLANTVFGTAQFTDVKTNIGIVATRVISERPMIFKTTAQQAYLGKSSFAPGFGVSIGDAVQASCSAYPFFRTKFVRTHQGENVETMDGGFCANNPTLYAIADATRSLEKPADQIRVVSVGVGGYPTPKVRWFSAKTWFEFLLMWQWMPSARLLQKTLEINTRSMDQLRAVLFSDVQTVRINAEYTKPEMATDMLEHDLAKLDMLYQRGIDSGRENEPKLREFLI